MGNDIVKLCPNCGDRLVYVEECKCWICKKSECMPYCEDENVKERE